MQGSRPHSFTYIERYVTALRGLLRGEEVEFEGVLLQPLHSSVGIQLPQPPPPILIAANGPKKVSTAKAVGDGVMTLAGPQGGFDWSVLAICGTVLETSETFETPDVIERLLPGIAVLYHMTYEVGGDAVDQLPGGRQWREQIESFPAQQRHLVVHEGHAAKVPDREKPLISSSLGEQTFTGTAGDLGSRVDALAAAGVTELTYTPIGVDAHRELAAMARALQIDPR